MKFYKITPKKVSLRCAKASREWMNATSEGFANRCLPLRIANQHGWEILAPHAITSMWDGGNHQNSIKIMGQIEPERFAVSHFGFGILTFHIGGLIKTPKNFNLYVQGPVNSPKDAIYPLSGVVESDWSPMTFTMNWKFTRPNIAVHFEAGEPICSFFPVQRGYLEDIYPEIADIADDQELAEEHKSWSQSRSNFNADLKRGKTAEGKWQKHYYKGTKPNNTVSVAEGHQTSLKLNEFKKP